MDRDDFIITVYCLVCAQYDALAATQPIRRGGFLPTLTDQEVITMQICGEFWHLADDTALYRYFASHYRHFFPQLPDRASFVRQAANLWQVSAALQQRLTIISGQASDPVQVIDTMPVPVCGLTRGPRDRCFKTVADYGYCAAKQLRYYGFKLGLRIARSGMIIAYPLLPARPHDIQLLDELVLGYRGVVPADKGFIDAARQARLAEQHGVLVLTPARKGMAKDGPFVLQRAGKRLRKRVETVGAQLSARFAVAHIRVRDLWHLQHRLIRKVLAHTVGVFLNLQLGRPALQLEGLVTT